LTFCEADEKTIEDINTNGAIVIWYDTPTGGTPLSSNYVLVNSQVLYAATYNSTSGCESLDRQSVTITTFDCEVKVNNLLTLDGNNLNDNLNIINIESFPANEIEIYNRYGQVVWRIENYNNTTNTFKGRANVGGVYQINDNLPTGTYYYVLKYYNPHRNKYEVTKSYLYISNTN
jgi:gliding motility-associated-like protein